MFVSVGCLNNLAALELQGGSFEPDYAGGGQTLCLTKDAVKIFVTVPQ
jgi:hypothetical protein